MASGADAGPVHERRTRRSGYAYQFYTKHHGFGGRDAAQWLPSLSHEEEFAIFDEADEREIADDRGRLYGMRRRDASGSIPDLGTLGQQVAEFPPASPPSPWHGYPIWSVAEVGPQNRRGEECRPSKVVFAKMQAAGMITERERRRLFKGHHL